MVSRLVEIDPNSDAEIIEALRRTESSRGYVSNLLRLLMHAPKAQQAYSELGHQLRFETDLSELQRELAICATVRNVPYGWAHHSGLLSQLGLTETQMAALKSGLVPDHLSAPDEILCSFALAYAACDGISDTLLADMQQHFSNRQIVEIGMIISYYLSSGALIIAFNPEIETAEQLQRELEWQNDRPRI